MNRFLSLIGSVVLLTCAPLAKAYIIEDVITFNRTLEANDRLAWTHDLTQYGYVPETPYTSLSLTLELRDLQDYPDKEVLDRPFFMLNIGQGRSFGRILMEDIEEGGITHLDAKGMMRPALTILGGKVWIGRAIVRMGIADPVSVREPDTLWLMLLGAVTLLFARRRLTYV